MTAVEINRLVRRTLVENGFRDIIPSRDADRVIKETLVELNITSHKVSVEQSPVHSPGEPIACNCSMAVIRVEPLARLKK